MLKPLIVFVLSLNLQAQTVKTDLQSEELNLKGTVKSCQELFFYISEDYKVDTKDTTYNHINFFNKKGYFEKEVHYSKTNPKKDYFEQLNILNKKLRSEVKQLPNFCMFTYYHYDKKGKLVELTTSYSENAKAIYGYPLNKIIKTNLDSGQIVRINVQEFDANGNLILQYESSKFGGEQLDTVYKIKHWYNTNNKEIKRELYKLYDPTTAVFKIPDETELFEYNNKQQLEKRIKISANLYGEVPTYDTTISYYQKYDSYNHPTEILKGKDYVTYTYTYDKKGNWIKKETFINGKLEEYEERVIDYYKP